MLKKIKPHWPGRGINPAQNSFLQAADLHVAESRLAGYRELSITADGRLQKYGVFTFTPGSRPINYILIPEQGSRRIIVIERKKIGGSVSLRLRPANDAEKSHLTSIVKSSRGKITF